jgi:hypothetical protein
MAVRLFFSSLVVACVFLFNAGPSASAADHLYDIAEVVGSFRSLENQRVTVKGYLTIEPENRSLWAQLEGYGDPQPPCLTVLISDSLFNRREAFNRTLVYMSGVISGTGCNESGCTGDCSEIRLLDATVVRSFPVADFDVPRANDATFRRVDKEVPQYSLFRSFGMRLMKTIIDPSRHTRILGLVSRKHRALLAEDLANPDSRSNWLLFSGERSVLNTALQRDVSLRVIQFDSYVVYLCFCREAKCRPESITPQRVWYRGAGDPNICLQLDKDADRHWYLDVSYLIGHPHDAQIDD